MPIRITLSRHVRVSRRAEGKVPFTGVYSVQKCSKDEVAHCMASIEKEGPRLIPRRPMSVKQLTTLGLHELTLLKYFTLITGECPAAKASLATDCLFQNAGPRRCERAPCFQRSIYIHMKCCKNVHVEHQGTHFDVQL
jgi:hypothetical protein